MLSELSMCIFTASDQYPSFFASGFLRCFIISDPIDRPCRVGPLKKAVRGPLQPGIYVIYETEP